MNATLRNWSEDLTFTPRAYIEAASEDEIVDAVHRARDLGVPIRPMGSRHSSTPLFATDGFVIDTSRMSGLQGLQADRALAALGPGTGLAGAGRVLHEAGLSMTNLGDVDYQTLAGAFGTGTHGTGLRLGNLSTMLVGGVLITATGERLPFGTEAGEDPDCDRVRAVRVSLGSLGILTSMTLQLVEASDLHVRKWITEIDWVLDHFDELAAANRHFDFYWYPRSDQAQVRIMNAVGADQGPTPPGRLKLERTGPAHEVIPNDRQLKFHEMEYMVPIEIGLSAFREARERIRERHRSRVGWRVLVRTVAADTAMLSPSYQRPTLTVALLHNHSLPYAEYFGDMEPLLQAYEGRPHWGKVHSMRAADLSSLYPDWAAFQRLRRDLDPDGTLMTPYLYELLEGPLDA